MTDKILIVNDASKLSDVIRVFLKNEGYTVITTSSKSEALEMCDHHRPDLIILNQESARWCEDGLCKELSLITSAGIIVLSCKQTKDAIICGYRSGADDYIAMPFDMDIFLVRVEALIRRIKGKSRRLSNSNLDITFDSFSNKVLIRNTVVTLTQTEFLIFYSLYQSKRFVTTKELTDRIYGGSGQDIPTRTISVHISKIRKKLEASGMTHVVLESKYNQGYRIYFNQ